MSSYTYPPCAVSPYCVSSCCLSISWAGTPGSILQAKSTKASRFRLSIVSKTWKTRKREANFSSRQLAFSDQPPNRPWIAALLCVGLSATTPGLPRRLRHCQAVDRRGVRRRSAPGSVFRRLRNQDFSLEARLIEGSNFDQHLQTLQRPLPEDAVRRHHR